MPTTLPKRPTCYQKIPSQVQIFIYLQIIFYYQLAKLYGYPNDIRKAWTKFRSNLKIIQKFAKIYRIHLVEQGAHAVPQIAAISFQISNWKVHIDLQLSLRFPTSPFAPQIDSNVVDLSGFPYPYHDPHDCVVEQQQQSQKKKKEMWKNPAGRCIFKILLFKMQTNTHTYIHTRDIDIYSCREQR